MHGKSHLTTMTVFFLIVHERIEGRAIDVVFADFSKFFDKVTHSRLV